MPLYACPRCHNIFPSPDKPLVCPDCGHQRPLPASEVLFLNKPKASFYTSHLLRNYVLNATPELCLDTYKGYRWEFSRMVKQDRIALQLEGYRESRLLMRSEDGTPLVKGWNCYGPALRLLYNFEATDPHKAPNLGNINGIDLEKIAAEPSEAYRQFLLDWLEAVKDVPSPMDFILPEAKPLLKLMKKKDL